MTMCSEDDDVSDGNRWLQCSMLLLFCFCKQARIQGGVERALPPPPPPQKKERRKEKKGKGKRRERERKLERKKKRKRGRRRSGGGGGRKGLASQAVVPPPPPNQKNKREGRKWKEKRKRGYSGVLIGGRGLRGNQIQTWFISNSITVDYK